MNIFNLLQHARIRLATNDPEFHNATDTTVAILRSSGVLPWRRSSINGELHKLTAAVIVEAHETGETIDIATRRAGTFNRYGYSTKIISFFDKMVQTNLLQSATGKAKGQLVIGSLLQNYIAA
tara:strand:- start:233 stop:601 length:369 start_codon:yes stop_codon:yes gene_type:complete